MRMSLTSGRLFRAIEYRSRLAGLAVSGPSHSAYLSEHPDELAARDACMYELEKEVAHADIEGCDRESLLSELRSYRRTPAADNGMAYSDDGLLDALKPTWRDVIVAAISAYATWKGRGWLERRAEEFARKQAAYVAEELRRS